MMPLRTAVRPRPRLGKGARWIAGAALAALVGATLPVLVGIGADARAEPPKEGWLADPPVTKSTKHWVFDIDVKSGVVSLGKARAATTPKPEGTPRMMGRYALELFSGRELLDRVRFNVPGMGDAPREDKRILKRPTMDRVTTKFSIRIADNPRTNWARVVDRATGDEVYIAWPPDEVSRPAPTASASAGPTGAVDAGPPGAGLPEPALPPGAYMTDAGFIVDPPSAPADAGSKDAGSKDAGPMDAGSNDAAAPGDAAPPIDAGGAPSDAR